MSVVDIRDDDAPPPPPPELSVGDVEVDEGDTAYFKVSLSAKATKEVTFDYATKEHTAKAGDDYESKSGNNEAIPVGESSVFVAVRTMQDSLNEKDESFYLDISDVQNATVKDARGEATIEDDTTHEAKPKLSVTDVSVKEGDAATFKVQLSTTAKDTVTFDYTTSNGSAEAGKDYDAKSGNNVTIAKGSSHTTITVQTRKDSLTENDETFYLDISDVHNATVDDSRGQGTTKDDSKPPPPSPPVKDPPAEDPPAPPADDPPSGNSPAPPAEDPPGPPGQEPPPSE